MVQRTIVLDEESSAILSEFMESEAYPDEATAIQQAFRALKHVNKDYFEKLETLRAEIDKGLNSGIVEGNPFDRIRARHGWPARVAR